jgi:PAS domain S-box-containing protein
VIAKPSGTRTPAPTRLRTSSPSDRSRRTCGGGLGAQGVRAEQNPAVPDRGLRQRGEFPYSGSPRVSRPPDHPDTRRASIAVAALAIVIGASVLLSWIVSSGFDVIKAPLRGAQAMVPDTALMILLTGVAVILHARGAGRGRAAIARGLAALVIAIAGASLVGRIAGVDLGLTRHLVTGAPLPARITAAAFVALGLALLTIDQRPRRGPAVSELLALVAAVAAVVVAIAYLFDYAYFATPSSLEGSMAIHTALAVIALAVALLLARPDRGLMAILSSPFVGGVMARRLLGFGLVAVPAGGLVSVVLQHLGLFPSPGAAVVDSVISMVTIVIALLVLAHTLNRADARRTDVEAELRQWKRFFDAVEFGAVFGGPDGRLLRVNHAFARMHGHTVAELEGRPLGAVFTDEARAELAAHLDAVERTGHHRFESVHVRADGTTFPVVIDATAVRDSAGRLLYRAAYVQDISAEQEADKARARLAALVASADDAIIAKDLDGTVLEWNHGAERAYGWSAAEVVGRPITAIIPTDLRDQRDDVHERVLRGELVRGLETERVTRHGARLPVSVTYSSITDGRGRVIGISMIERDISDRRATEAALATAHQRLASVVDASQAVTDAVTRLPTTGLAAVLEVIAQQAKLLTGADYAAVTIDAPDAAAGPIAEVGAVPARLARGTDPVPAAREAGDDATDIIDVPVTFRGRRKGSIVLIGKQEAGFGAGDRLATEMLASHLGSAVEVALLYQRESLQRGWLASVLAQMPESVVVVDAHGRLLLENEARRQLPVVRGHDPASGLSTPRNLYLPSGEPIPLDRMPIARALAGESVDGEEYMLRRPDGISVPLLISARPVHDGDAIVGGVALARDISAIKELERRREEWSSVIAHDLRQPINGIRLAAELLQRKLEPRHQTWADRIRADALRLNAMIEDLLDSSRLEAKRLSLRLAPARLGESVDVVLARLPGIAERVELHVEPGAALVTADARRLVQVLGNLLSNAEKYGTPGTPVEVAATRDGAMVEVRITNHGDGIPADEISRLFDRFVRTRGALERQTEGIGLGLYLSKGLIEAQGGRMWVDSTPGATTTFHFTLPAAPAREEPRAPAAPVMGA